MRTLFVTVSLLILSSCASTRRPEFASRHTHPDPTGVKNALSEINIPEARFEKNTLAPCAIAYWAAATQHNDPEARGVSHVFKVGDDPGPFLDLVVADISSLDLLNEICRQADLVWWLTPKCMMIWPRSTTEAEQPAP